MLFLREILLLAVVLCVCWETGDNSCGVECDASQRGLALPTCYLRDDGTSSFCGISLCNTDTEIRTLGNFDKLTLMLDLQTRVSSLYLYCYTSECQLKVGTFRFHMELTSLILYCRNIHINPGMFFFLPNLKFLQMSYVFFDYFPYFARANRLLTYLFISEFDIPSTTPRILTGAHVSGLTGLKYLSLTSDQYMSTTDQSFAGLTALTHLFMQRFHFPNPVTTLSPLVRLRKLRLKRCELVLLECGLFTGLSNLKYLWLDNNPIQDICFTALQGLASLTELSLESTPLTSLSSRMFEYLPSLKTIDLTDTPLHCDCSLQWLSRVHHNFSLTIDNARCASPSEHINKRATDLPIYRDCTQDLSYQCFNRSISCPSGTSCQDTLDTYSCVCQQEGDMFVRSLNRCVSRISIINCLS